MDNAKGWKIEFDKALVNGQAVTVEVHVILGSALEMYPSEIEQKEKQLVSYEIQYNHRFKYQQDFMFFFIILIWPYYQIFVLGYVFWKPLRILAI